MDYDFPFDNLCKEIKECLTFAQATKDLAFPQYNEVATGIFVILSKIFPPSLNKYIAESYQQYIDKYAKSMLWELKPAYETSWKKSKQVDFNTKNEYTNDLTEAEYCELIYQDI